MNVYEKLAKARMMFQEMNIKKSVKILMQDILILIYPTFYPFVIKFVKN